MSATKGGVGGGPGSLCHKRVGVGRGGGGAGRLFTRDKNYHKYRTGHGSHALHMAYQSIGWGLVSIHPFMDDCISVLSGEWLDMYVCSLIPRVPLRARAYYVAWGSKIITCNTFTHIRGGRA